MFTLTIFNGLIPLLPSMLKFVLSCRLTAKRTCVTRLNRNMSDSKNTVDGNKLPPGMRINHYGVVERITLGLTDWKERWKRDFCGFHKTEVHPDLLKHCDQMLPKTGRVFVPLCGKTLDMKYLVEKGNEVVGLEFSDKAVKAFFEENNIEYTVAKEEPFDVYRGKNIAIFNGDFYKVTPAQLGTFDAIWDRASFVAINPEDRAKYAQLITSLMNQSCAYLLNAFHYETDTFIGPPHSMTDDEIYSYFTGICDVTKLNAADTLTEQQRAIGFKSFATKNFILKLK